MAETNLENPEATTVVYGMEKLVREARELFSVSLSTEQVTLLSAYERELLEWNKKFNLTAIRDEQGNIVKWYGSSNDIEDRINAAIRRLVKMVQLP